MPQLGQVALPHWAAQAPAWVVAAVAALVGAVAGWLIGRPLNWTLGVLFRTFNAGFTQATRGYVRLVGGLLRVSVMVLVVYGGLLGLTWVGFNGLPQAWIPACAQKEKLGTFDPVSGMPKSFVPLQDMGYLLVNVQLPDSASTERTDQVMRHIEQIALHTPGVKHVTGISGQSFVLNAAGPNFGSMFVNLKDYPERRDPSLSSDAIANSLRGQFAREIRGANVAVFGPPPVRGVGRAGGFALMIEDRGDLGPTILQEQTDDVVRAGATEPGLVGMFSVFRANVPQWHINPNSGACMVRGVSLKDFSSTLEVYEGSFYVNDFNLFGRTWQVVIQAESEARRHPEDLPQLRTRSAKGAMVPLGSLATQRETYGPLILTRYNMYPAASINGTAAPGVSSGDVMAKVQRMADQRLPQAMKYEWTDMSYLELLAGNTAMILFGFAVVMVFLVLAAQYESWSLPMAVILVVPMCLLCSIIGVAIAQMDINIFTQIGFVVLVGLASKNAILIVEFAKQQRHEGLSRRDATLAACQLRLRPIVMTSFAFIFGVIPLIISRGAGAEMRRTLGTAVFSGMLGVTLFGIVLTPVFFFTIDWLGGTRLFASPLMQRVGSLGLDVLTLRPVWRASGQWAWRLGKAALRRPGSVEPPEQE
jgi:hydrophobe/amphiphile efflux-1 (HAE1) family protein